MPKSTKTDYCTLFATVPDKAEAQKMARVLIEEKLVACVNISDAMMSLYEWDGKIFEDYERALFIKTRKDRADEAISRIKELHPYDVPCVVQWDITGGNEDYLKWVGNSVKQR